VTILASFIGLRIRCRETASKVSNRRTADRSPHLNRDGTSTVTASHGIDDVAKILLESLVTLSDIVTSRIDVSMGVLREICL